MLRTEHRWPACTRPQRSTEQQHRTTSVEPAEPRPIGIAVARSGHGVEIAGREEWRRRSVHDVWIRRVEADVRFRVGRHADYVGRV